jgi:hypothetical protein
VGGLRYITVMIATLEECGALSKPTEATDRPVCVQTSYYNLMVPPCAVMTDPASALLAGLADSNFPRACCFERVLKTPDADGSARREGNMPAFAPTAEQEAS